MKRKREGFEKKGSEIRSVIEELSSVVRVKPGVHQETALIPSRPFLSICNLFLQVLDKIGPTMAVLRQDVHQNIQRLEKLYESDPSIYSNLVEVLKKEDSEGTARKPTSSARALVWLTRSMDFAVALLDKLVKEPDQTIEQAVESSYDIALKPWHGWISSAAYRVALKLIPDRKTFICLLMAGDEDYDKLKEDLQSLVSLLLPLLDDIHSILRSFRLDKLKSS
ncbi:glycolipid transfer protein 3-like [Telopea speciosissima]|uniref:glycolipid transfer protein 3-like n=1 Tax=Telopea speciosissima TaxID=54955 RepID=UPI001CC7819F|nr:glycolipid transfer protein 3-like [Telopea speciosissima]XP_043720375.1 glycolipid transfer protein 3-like [Telopea speciosissima]